MIVEPNREIPDLGETDVCVIGAGAAGIALAVELGRAGLRVVLVEDGGLTAEPKGRSVYKVLPGPKVALGVDDSRKFFLGGNTNHWYGNCRPLDNADFSARAWLPHSGWPVQRDELLPYYRRAQTLSGLGSFDWYDTNACRPYLEEAGSAPLDSAILETRIVQTPPVFSFADLHREFLAHAPNVTVLLGYRVLRLKGDHSAKRLIEVETVRQDGSAKSVTAKQFVVAAGGVENARILLASGPLLAGGPSRSELGKYFQEHWYYIFETDWAHESLFGRSRNLRLYDAGVGAPEDALETNRTTVGDAKVWAQLVLSERVMGARRLPGLALWFSASYGSPPSLGALKRSLRRRRGLARGLAGEVIGALRHPVGHAEYAWLKLVARGRPARRLALIAQFEQLPHASNRVYLSASADAFGQPVAALDLELDEEQRRAHGVALEIAANELGLNGRDLAEQMERKYSMGDFGYFWHHMGTTRMGNDPSVSVVDRDCRVHGIENLFVAGSSVFPNSGTAAPTLTIVALAIRLADHLASLPRDERANA